jgi:GT2 family glycosyltransferase
MPSPPVHVIILSFNGKKLTTDCIASCLRLNYDNAVLAVIDNASSDGSADAIKNIFGYEISAGKVVLIENELNLGFAGGNNVGMRYALEHGAGFILLLNNDTIVDPDLLTHLVSSFEQDPRVGIIGPKIYYFDPPDQIWFAGGKIDLHKGVSRHIGIREKDQGQFESAAACDYITGCAMMIKRAVIESVGYLDTIYTMYSEDADYCFRAKEKQFTMMMVPSGKVWHKISAAAGGQVRPRKMLLRLWSNYIFLRRYARWYHWLSIPFFFAWDGLRIIVLVLLGRIRNE